MLLTDPLDYIGLVAIWVLTFFACVMTFHDISYMAASGVATFITVLGYCWCLDAELDKLRRRR